MIIESMILAKLLCKILGHRRGKRVLDMTFTTTTHLNHYRCGRCGATWTRRAKPVQLKAVA